MSNWYYVDGAERVGPVEREFLLNLFEVGKIDTETYVWRKGFTNWERLKSVGELNFQEEINVKKFPKKKVVQVELDEEDENQDSVHVNNYQDVKVLDDETIDSIEPFSWQKFDRNDSIFFVKIGLDRPYSNKVLFGPYSLHEIIDAYQEKRINERTLLFTLGLNDWQAIGSIPFFKDELNLNSLALPVDTKDPIYFVGHYNGEFAVFLIKKGHEDKAQVLSSQKFFDFTELKVSLFSGSQCVKKNISLRLEDSNIREQTLMVDLFDINDDVIKVFKELNERE